MTNKQSIMLAMVGAAFVAASPARAQNTYNNLDLLLSFRNVTTPTDPDVTIDVGNVTAFVSAVTANGGAAILNTGNGYTASFSSGFSYAGLAEVLGAPSANNVIGFSAAAADSTGGTGLLYLTRTQPTGAFGAPAHKPDQQSLQAQATTAEAIGFIGAETASADATTLDGSSANAVSYPSGDSYSYQSWGQDPANHSIIDYHGSQSTATGSGGVLESQQNGAGNIYEALWKVPVDGNGVNNGPAAYLGFFTFQSSGEVDFTSANVVTRPPNPQIALSADHSTVTVFWQGNYTLQQNSNLTLPGGWSTSSYPISTLTGTNSITITPPTGNLFFRLANP